VGHQLVVIRFVAGGTAQRRDARALGHGDPDLRREHAFHVERDEGLFHTCRDDGGGPCVWQAVSVTTAAGGRELVSRNGVALLQRAGSTSHRNAAVRSASSLIAGSRNK